MRTFLRRTTIAAAATAATLGLATAPASAAEWTVTEESWQSPTDRGGQDAEAAIHWSGDPRSTFAVVDFQADGEHFYAVNRSGEPLLVSWGGPVGSETYRSLWLDPGTTYEEDMDLPEGTRVHVRISDGHDLTAWEKNGVA